jgi:phosphatidate cytidylyltransferase
VDPALPVKYLGITLLLFVGLLMYMVVNHQDFKEYAYVLAGLLYIGLPVALSPFVVSTGSGYSGLLMLAFFIIIWSSDVGAYCFGMLFGQKLWPAKMCPEISPKKSWAGFFGGWLTVLLAAYILLKTGMIAFPVVHVLVMASLMHITGVFGDLYESLWKRQFGVKDSGNIMPGHGGLLDRFDSALFAIPTAYVYLVLFELV